MSHEIKCPVQTGAMDLLLTEFYVEGAAATRARQELDAETQAALSAHVETCAACTAFRSEQKAVWEALDLWEPAPVNLGFNRELWQKIDAAAALPWYRNLGDSLRAYWKPMIPLAAAVLAIAGGFLLDHPGAKNATPDFSIVEADQVEQTLDDIQLLRQFDSGTTQGGSQAGQQKQM